MQPRSQSQLLELNSHGSNPLPHLPVPEFIHEVLEARVVMGRECSAQGEAVRKVVRLSTSRISPSVEYPNRSFWASTLPEE